ncbi:hypothetical protein [Pseudoxanthomonas koreensis]|uniref:hypothetical protein n=1 Tax=Pseudoxanthomonas koreensis TaxID=266061 RepID=UPI0035A590F6
MTAADAVIGLLPALAYALLALGGMRLHRAMRANRQRRAFAEYRAACLVVTERAKLRAGQHRAQVAEWGRA